MTMVWMPLLTNSTFCWWFSHPVRGLTWCFLVYHSPSPKELRPFEGLFDHHDPLKRPFFRASFFFFRGGNFGGGTPSTSHEISEVECNDLGGGLSPSILKNQKYSSIFFQTGKGAPPQNRNSRKHLRAPPRSRYLKFCQSKSEGIQMSLKYQ